MWTNLVSESLADTSDAWHWGHSKVGRNITMQRLKKILFQNKGDLENLRFRGHKFRGLCWPGYVWAIFVSGGYWPVDKHRLIQRFQTIVAILDCGSGLPKIQFFKGNKKAGFFFLCFKMSIHVFLVHLRWKVTHKLQALTLWAKWSKHIWWGEKKKNTKSLKWINRLLQL